MRVKVHRGSIGILALVPAAMILGSCGGPSQALNHGAGITALAFSTSGPFLASGGVDGRIKLWRVSSDKPILELAPGPDGIKELAFSPDGRKFGGAQDGELRVWRVDSGQLDRTVSLDEMAGDCRLINTIVIYPLCRPMKRLE